eukprot:TRINITY_DN113_c0_g1_i1.p1 TRINITY_DN113_c0_g1~~TRINITY_DN113_c0_g1_i1.p1  ORF type:complete len:184 (-),score=47.24 TRINITY_DN113_c0_g1_i1:41-592(-)
MSHQSIKDANRKEMIKSLSTLLSLQDSLIGQMNRPQMRKTRLDIMEENGALLMEKNAQFLSFFIKYRDWVDTELDLAHFEEIVLADVLFKEIQPDEVEIQGCIVTNGWKELYQEYQQAYDAEEVDVFCVPTDPEEFEMNPTERTVHIRSKIAALLKKKSPSETERKSIEFLQQKLKLISKRNK